MRWRVHGASDVTGGDISTTVIADTENEARARANLNGILVSDVKPEGKLPSKTVDYATPKPSPAPPQFEPPRYRGLSFAAGICTVVGGLYLLIGGILVVLALVAQSNRTLTSDVAFSFGVTFISCLAVGGLMFGLSAACDALRDIARNSWRR